MVKVFIDGSAGTTGLRIHERLAIREDIKLITLLESERKSISERKNQSQHLPQTIRKDPGCGGGDRLWFCREERPHRIYSKGKGRNNCGATQLLLLIHI